MKNKVLNIIDNYIKKWFILVPMGFLIIIWFFQKDNFFMIKFGKLIFEDGGSYSTLASIFAGIFFSLYTLLLSLPNFSVIRNLTKQNYNYLLISITFGLVYSLSFCVLQIIIPIFNKNDIVMGINALLFIAFILSVIQCAIYFTLELHSDLKSNFQSDSQMENDIKYIKEWVKSQNS